MADYSGLEKFLHRMALGKPAVAEMLHDLERSLFLKSAPQARQGAHVIVAGLARAGTTILMREIHATGDFASLTYADMPFVLAPNLWSRVARKTRPGLKAERAHGDGIEVDTQSPEALEEVYWRLFCSKDYLSREGLSPHLPSRDAMAGYVDLIRLVLRKTGKTRYLAKNNNAILRLPSLARGLPQAVILVPIRAPLAHAQSLLNQHRRFLGADDFTADYMTWLGHHEFGRGQRPFLFDSPPTGDPLSLDYWLEMWISVYRHLGETVAGLSSARMIPHEDLTGNPAVWPALCNLLDLAGNPLKEARMSGPRETDTHSADLAQEAEQLYQALRKTALQRLLAPAAD